MGKTPFPSLFMDILQSPPPRQPKICYNKNCIIRCDSLPFLLPSLVVFFSVFQLNACAYASVPSETYDQVTQELDFSHAVLGAEKSGEIGVLASPCLSCKPAQIPSLIQPLQIWDAVWTSHWVLASEMHQWAPLRFRYICLGTTKVPQRKLC